MTTRKKRKLKARSKIFDNMTRKTPRNIGSNDQERTDHDNVLHALQNTPDIEKKTHLNESPPALIEDNIESPIHRKFGRTTTPLQMNDENRRRKWGLPPLTEPWKRGQYIVELNVLFSSGLVGAASEFLARFESAMRLSQMRRQEKGEKEPAATWTAPVKLAKSYYRCKMTEDERQILIEYDEEYDEKSRVIYRLWPDFPVNSQIDRSITTVKADAAFRSFGATGTGIVWAVIDSGVDSSHLHFGDTSSPLHHLLLHPDVVDLHRCFADVGLDPVGATVASDPLESPDWTATMPEDVRNDLLDKHRRLALRDEFGHGTHVAGIISGSAPHNGAKVRVLERQYKVDSEGKKTNEFFVERNLEIDRGLRGVAPLCKLVSLRILDHEGRGRTSNIIQALEYIREKINDNPKLMRVHGVNLSVGYEFDAEMFAAGQSPICTEVNRLVQEGVVVVAAAGNTGYGTIAAAAGPSNMGLASSINDPGNAASAITVGSTHRDSPHTYGISYFSSKGPTGDGRLKPDLVAPGERITSCAAGKKLTKAFNKASLQISEQEKQQDTYYVDESGTSMAAPHVSGAIAGFLSIRREFIGKPDAVKKIFLESATDLKREKYFQGSGLIDLMKALQSV